MSDPTSITNLPPLRIELRHVVAPISVILLIAILAMAAPRLVPNWDHVDWLIVVTGAFAAMACSIPGIFLLLRRQSMMGDALSHTVLPGVVAAVIFSEWARHTHWLPAESFTWFRQLTLFIGALFVGIVSSLLMEWIQRLGRVEASAALGVVFTTLFAIGLVMIRRAADIHIDMDCVLYGNIENATISALIPLVIVFTLNLLLTLGFYKELKIAAFDPALATTMGINARLMHYALMAMTAATLVLAFERVGSILVIAMLIVPAATSFLLTQRLGPMLAMSLLLGIATAILGHLSAIVVPPAIFPRLGFEALADASASTAGSMAVAAGGLFVIALLLSPRQGVITSYLTRWRLSLRIAMEDVLGRLYRSEETASNLHGMSTETLRKRTSWSGPGVLSLALRRLRMQGLIVTNSQGYTLTDRGRSEAKKLVRAHRLWESYMAEHFELPEDHLHETAERVEHFIDPEIREALAAELKLPVADPHGKRIPRDND